MEEHICRECTYYMRYYTKIENDYIPVNDGKCVIGEREDIISSQETCRFFVRRLDEKNVLYF